MTSLKPISFRCPLVPLTVLIFMNQPFCTRVDGSSFPPDFGGAPTAEGRGWVLWHVPYPADGQHGLLWHHGVQAVNRHLLQHYLRSTTRWTRWKGAVSFTQQEPAGLRETRYLHPEVPDPTAGRAMPTTEPQTGRGTCRHCCLQALLLAGPPRCHGRMCKDGDPEQLSSTLLRLAEPLPGTAFFASA